MFYFQITIADSLWEKEEKGREGNKENEEKGKYEKGEKEVWESNKNIYNCQL